MRKKLDFNEFQLAVIRYRKGHAVAMASPGSGKTSVVVKFVNDLLAEGVLIAQILCTTFTKEGALEMTDRAGIKSEHKLFSTFHSWALQFVKREAQHFPFRIRNDWHGNPNPLALPMEAARHLGPALRAANIKLDKLDRIEYKEVQGYISLCKRRGINPNKAMLEAEGKGERQLTMALVYARYEESMRKAGILDFDSIVVESARLLTQREDVRARWQYRYVVVDEAQDTDAVQWRIVQCISERHGNVLAVGDENQAMYSWRGSEGNLTEYFKKIFPDAIVFPLPINYRSTEVIVNYCKEIAPVKNEAVAHFTHHEANAGGQPIDYKLYNTEDDEAKATMNSITDFENTAILARTNAQLGVFETECSARNYRYKTLGKSGFWATSEVKDVVGIVGSVVFPTDGAVSRMLMSRCEVTKYLRKHDTFRDGERLKGVVTLLKDFQDGLPFDPETGKPPLLHKLLGRFNSGEQMDEQIHHIASIIQELRGRTRELSAGEALHLVLDRFGVREFYMEQEDKDESFDNDPLENIEKLASYANKDPNLTAFYEHIQRVYRAQRARSGYITLSTVHQAKGKEWKNVFVVGVNQDVLPHIKGDPLEELKIYHVACSRAAKRLTVSCNGVPSPLIEKLVQRPLDNWEGFQLESKATA